VADQTPHVRGKLNGQTKTTAELLSDYGALLDELRRHGIVRSGNNPLSDYAEVLFCAAFKWTRLNNSAHGHDAVDAGGLRYQIKGRRLTPQSTSRQLSAIRNLEEIPFDYSAGVLVDRDFQVLRAAIIPFAVVRAKCTRVEHSNSWRFLLRDDIWNMPGVRDVTGEIKAAAKSI
jgi:hypothetical protein